MMRSCAALGIVALLSGGVLGQASPPAPSFDVADVQISGLTVRIRPRS